MKRIFCIILILSFSTGCTYHGTIRRGIYKTTALQDRINALVLVIADRNIPQEIYITDPDKNDSRAFVLQTADGTAVAVADALATLFKYVDAGYHQIQDKYDYAADVTLESGLTRNNCEGELSKWSVRTTGLCTLITVSIRRANSKEPLATAKASSWREFSTPGLASTLKWLSQHTFILSPLFTPFYMQAQGRVLRKQFEENLTEALNKIVGQLETQRNVFENTPQKTDF